MPTTTPYEFRMLLPSLDATHVAGVFAFISATASQWRVFITTAALYVAAYSFFAAQISRPRECRDSKGWRRQCLDGAKPATHTDGLIFFGNGCFWERMWSFVQLEQAWDRRLTNITARAGYTGGAGTDSNGKVCYHCSIAGLPVWCMKDYAQLGHAEAVQVELSAGAAGREQFAALANNFFGSFTGPPGRRIRSDRQNRGPAYRSLVGLPGGMASPLYPLLTRANLHAMELRESGTGSNPDAVNVVWIHDTSRSPFFVAEAYHQFHSDSWMSEGMPYNESYVHGLWGVLTEAQLVRGTGCPEERHW